MLMPELGARAAPVRAVLPTAAVAHGPNSEASFVVWRGCETCWSVERKNRTTVAGLASRTSQDLLPRQALV